VFPADDRVAIEALHSAWLDAELRGDSSALLHFCTRTPVWLPPNEEPLCGRAAILRWLTDQHHTGVLRIDIDDLVISGSGSFASKLATFRTTVEGPARAGSEVITGSHGWLLQRDDAGAWRISVVGWTIAGAAVK
jgi:ketosteroid isomerase-like protein